MNTQPTAQPSFELFFEACQQPFCVLTAEGRLMKWNAACARALGRSAVDLTDKPLDEIVVETDRAQVRSALGGLFPGPSTADLACRVRRGDGSTRMFSLRASTYDRGDLAYGVFEDITGRQANPTGRLLTEEVYQQILDSIEDMVLVKGPRSKVIWANKAFRDLYGMTNAELHGLVDSPRNEPDLTQQYVRDDLYVFETGNRLVIDEEPATRHDGAIRTVTTVKSALRGARGEVIGTVGVSRDITDRRRAERDRQLLEQAIGAASQGILVAASAAEELPVTYVNAAYARLSGRPVAELLGASFRRLVDSVADAAASERLARAIAERREVSVEFPAERDGGARAWMRMALTPVRDASGQVTSFVAIQADITAERERQRHELALKEQRHLIERQQRTIHALVTPIIEIWDGVLTMPIIGVVDSVRAAEMMAALLEAVSVRRARFTIVDLTGVDIVDTATANHLLKLVRAARLLGTTCALSGISPAVSRTLVGLGVELGELRTFSTLRAALRHVLGQLGVSVVKARA
ncbi:PAS domain-containing protein [Sorangium sp. So ce1078]|uniref:PAS domain-containing protein n=1 Tax=Sorangium sp. So ce1078 TaxID=3133329 RepID=UPI003F5EBAF6